MEGASGAAGELGHMTIDWRGERCSCGNVGCLEALASGTAIERKAQALIASGQGAELLAFASTLSERATPLPAHAISDSAQASSSPGEQPAKRVTASTIAQAAEAGIPLAREIIAQAAEALGVGLVNTLHIFNPEVIILGGGVTQMGSLLIDPAINFVKEHTMFSHLAGSTARIVQARLGSNSGLIGAGALLYYYQHLPYTETKLHS
jgi:glucokinase